MFFSDGDIVQTQATNGFHLQHLQTTPCVDFPRLFLHTWPLHGHPMGVPPKLVEAPLNGLPTHQLPCGPTSHIPDTPLPPF